MAISVLNTDSDLTGKTLITAENAYTISGLHTFSRNPGAPFAVTAGSATVTNLQVALLDVLGSGTVTAPSVAVGAANTGLYSSSSNNLDITVGGTRIANFNNGGAEQILTAGTAGAPTLYWAGDTTTGFYRNATNNLSITVGGSAAVTFASTGVNIAAGFDLFTTAQWQDFSASSTIVGWASFTTKNIFYKRVGNMVFVAFNLNGTSNSTSTSFTVATASNATNPSINQPALTVDAGSPVVGFVQLPANSSTVTAFSTYNSAAWTASGTKVISGQFFYQV